ncbi:MAG: phosphocholine cytidylyltransferase family protein [Planctomycetes bacterium]|nr:phosphocholine cytidylyltransferase family protein [Planctomycetota bacterium]
MKAVILSAGQGKRLLPLTETTPKCALEVAGRPIVQWQVDTLLEAGIKDVMVVVGHGAEKVEALMKPYGARVRCLYNPFHAVSDNLASCWVARNEMDGDFILLNGDTLFEVSVVRRLLEAERAINVTIDRKPIYDADDMKVHVQGDRLMNIGKTLSPEKSDAEAIGMILFRRPGALAFREALDRAMRRPDGLKHWYLKVVDAMAAADDVVGVCSIEGMRWAEVDTRDDLANASVAVVQPQAKSTTMSDAEHLA